MRLEGGFRGRTNKLVDACYSFWQGGSFALLSDALVDLPAAARAAGDVSDGPEEAGGGGAGAGAGGGGGGAAAAGGGRGGGGRGGGAPAATAVDGGVLFDTRALQRYILCCCQDVKGGLRDKPTK